MIELNPYLRYIAKYSHISNKRYTMAYDSRFFFVLSGCGYFLSEKEKIPLEAGTLLFYPSGIKYLFKPEREKGMKFITVNFDFMDNYPHGVVMPPVYPEDFTPELEHPTHKLIGEEKFSSPFVIENADFALGYLMRLLELYGGYGEYKDKLCSATLLALIYEILYRGKRKAQKSRAIDLAKEYVRCELSSPLSNNTVAKAIGYHPYYLGAVFKSNLGITLGEYINRVRFERAEELLTYTDDAVYSIAEACGFRTPEHFSKKFKSRFGISPNKWRKKLRQI